MRKWRTRGEIGCPAAALGDCARARAEAHGAGGAPLLGGEVLASWNGETAPTLRIYGALQVVTSTRQADKNDLAGSDPMLWLEQSHNLQAALP
jgi:hypothetical protein